jgi:hypothetical protein
MLAFLMENVNKVIREDYVKNVIMRMTILILEKDSVQNALIKL